MSRNLPRRLAALAAGALLACAFAPLQWWPLAILCPAILMYLWQGATPRQAAWLGFWFNVGTFAAGTYWLYISIHIFGQAPIWLALFIMAALVAIMGLYHAALGYASARWLPSSGAVRWMLGIPAAWLLIEWWRGWFLSGFSWLSLGYSQTDTWLVHLAPVWGVYGLSAVVLVSAGALVTLVFSHLQPHARRTRVIASTVLILPWLAGWALKSVQWTRPSGAPVGVAIVQGAIPQDLKWLESNRDTTLNLYRDLTRTALGTPLIVWPEAAPPDLAHNLVDYLRGIYREASERGSSLVLGISRVTYEEPTPEEQGSAVQRAVAATQDPTDEGLRYYNSVLAMDSTPRRVQTGDVISWYSKDHLVPFGEFFPVPDFVRSWMRLMSLPYGDFTRGGTHQPPLSAAGLNIAASVCYEDAYGSSQLQALREADVLVNVTNDAWFGHSSARHQHFQIARLRAKEAGRYLIRAANDGISAVIGPRGEVLSRAPQFKAHVLYGVVTPRRGLPPYAHVGNWLIVTLAVLALVVTQVWRLRRRSAAVGPSA